MNLGTRSSAIDPLARGRELDRTNFRVLKLGVAAGIAGGVIVVILTLTIALLAGGSFSASYLAAAAWGGALGGSFLGGFFGLLFFGVISELPESAIEPAREERPAA